MKVLSILAILAAIAVVSISAAPKKQWQRQIPVRSFRMDDDSGESDEADLADDEPQDDGSEEDDITGQNFEHMPQSAPAGDDEYVFDGPARKDSFIPTQQAWQRRPVTVNRPSFRDDDSDEEEDDEPSAEDDVVESDIQYSPSFPVSTFGESEYGVRRRSNNNFLSRWVTPYNQFRGRSSSSSSMMPTTPRRQYNSGSGSSRPMQTFTQMSPVPYRRGYVQRVQTPSTSNQYPMRRYQMVQVRPMSTSSVNGNRRQYQQQMPMRRVQQQMPMRRVQTSYIVPASYGQSGVRTRVPMRSQMGYYGMVPRRQQQMYYTTSS